VITNNENRGENNNVEKYDNRKIKTIRKLENNK